MHDRVLFVTEEMRSPSVRYRALNYFPFLREGGWEPRHLVAERGWGARLSMLRQVRRADVVVVTRKTFHGLTRQALRAMARRLVLDIDDAVFVRDDGSDSPTRRCRFAAMARTCDAVWAGNDYLAQCAARCNASVTVLPTAVDPALYRDARPAPDGGLVDLVWIGSGATRKYLAELTPVLRRLGQARQDVRLKIIADFDLDVAPLRTGAVPWSAATEIDELASAHIGLAPMPDDAWTRGKCGLKVLQYMMARLPVVSSDAGVHRTMVAHQETGLLVNQPEEWLAAITRLADNAALRRAMGDAGRRRALANYALPVLAKRMRDALESLRG
ncbi:MAG: glycosyltransferase family 4 protein [Phycisphaeraceae bacterium]